MKAIVFVIFFFGASTANAQLHVADDGPTMHPHCKAALVHTDHFTAEEGFCAGTVQTLATFGRILPEPYRFCPPRGVTHEVILRVVVDYLERRPEDKNSALWQIADSAFQHAWPCSD